MVNPLMKLLLKTALREARENGWNPLKERTARAESRLMKSQLKTASREARRNGLTP